MDCVDYGADNGYESEKYYKDVKKFSSDSESVVSSEAYKEEEFFSPNLKEETEMDLNSSVDSELNTSKTPEEELSNSTWKVGQLAWARMSTYPFWPCTVTYDPNSPNIYQKVQATNSKSKTHMVHVHFFNDNGQRSWIPSHRMFPFYGIEHFRQKAALVTEDIKKKEPKFAAAFVVKPNIFKKWQIAVAEAMDVLYELDMSALEMFKPRLKNITNDGSKKTNSIGKNNTKKRKRSVEAPGKGIKKYFRSSNSSDSVQQYRNNENVNQDEKCQMHLETPPISPATTDSNVKNQKKKIIKLQPPDFEVYYERNSFVIKEAHPECSDDEIRIFLEKTWNELVPQEKAKYRGTYKIDSPIKKRP